jgi:hypothetical protein
MGDPSAAVWERYREVFARDGRLRDIYVRGTDEGDWRTLLKSLRASPYEYEFTVDGERRPLPEDVNALFAPERVHAALLVVDGLYLGLHCHFFVPTEIEFDLDPQAVVGDEQLGRLLGFLHCAGCVRTRRTGW